jgi:hypothetical protein
MYVGKGADLNGPRGEDLESIVSVRGFGTCLKVRPWCMKQADIRIGLRPLEVHTREGTREGNSQVTCKGLQPGAVQWFN